MTLLKAERKPSMNGRGSAPVVTAGTPLPVRHKRPGYAALAVVLIVGLALVGAYLYSAAGRKVPVVMVIAHVPVGHTIERSDLSTVEVAGAVTAIGGANVGSVVGQTAVVELLPNTLLQRAMLTSTPALTTADAQVGVAVTPGQIPSDGVNPGDVVEVLQLPARNATGTAAAAPTVLTTTATVYSSTPDPSQSGGTLLTLVVPKAVAPGVAAASFGGLIALIRVGS